MISILKTIAFASTLATFSSALTEPMSATDATALGAKYEKQSELMGMFDKQVVADWGTSCKDISTKWKAAACADKTVSSECSKTEPCCKDGNKATKCSDAGEDWRKITSKAATSNRMEADQCCDGCLAGGADVNKAGKCGPLRYLASVCGGDKAEVSGEVPDDTKAVAGVPIADYTKDDCSMIGVLELNIKESDCDENDGVETNCKCMTTRAKLDAVYDLYAAGGFAGWPTMTPSEKTAYDAAGINAMLVHPVVSSGAGAVTKAGLNIKNNGAGCYMTTLTPTLNAPFTASVGGMLAYSPIVLEGGSLVATGTSEALVLSGSNKGTVTSTTTGQLHVHGLVNEKEGSLTCSDTTDGFVSSVTNHGTATFTNVIGSAINIINHGTITIDGTSNIKMTVLINTGTINWKGTAKGTLSIPSNQQSGVTVPSTVTLTATAAAANGPSPAPAPTPLGGAGSVTQCSTLAMFIAVAAMWAGRN